MAFQHQQYNRKFQQAIESSGAPANDAAAYDVRIAPLPEQAHTRFWRVIGVHHLTPEENQGRHAALVEILDENGQRVNDPALRIGWSWEGRRADEQAPPQALDKPASEPAGNVPINRGMNLELWIEGDGPSEKVQNMHTRHPDEPGPNGELWNSFGHHSYYVVFQRTDPDAQTDAPPEEQPATPDVPADPPAEVGTQTAPLQATIPLIFSNQQAINAFYYAAQRLGLGNWDLLEKASLDIFELAAARQKIYCGPALRDLPNLSQAERAAVREELLAELLKTVQSVGLVNAPAGLNLRTGPSTEHSILRTLPHETPVQVLGRVDEWLFVLAGEEAGYLHTNYVAERGEAEFPQVEQPEWFTGGEDLSPPAEQRIRLPEDADGLDQQIAAIWNSYGGALMQEAERLGLDPAVAMAVFAAESTGRGFVRHESGQWHLLIRFEVHIFFREWGQNNPEKFQQHFRYDTATVTSGHFWRAGPNDAWQVLHLGKQESEWAAFSFARSLDDTGALRSTSMGAPQIMGFNHAVIGYPTAQQMFDAFRQGMQAQLAGFFRFVESKGAVASIRSGDFMAFAEIYNGPLFAQNYAQLIRERLERARRLLAGVPPRTPGQRGVVPGAPQDVSARLPAPVTPDSQSLADTDPALYRAWSEHIRQGFENNNEMFHQVLKGFMEPYRTTIVMYRVMFGVGIFLFVAAAVLGYLTENETLSLIFGGLGIVTFLGYFLSRPLQALEENLQFITWLGVVYNTYWTRLAYTLDQATAHQEIEDATNEAVKEIEKLIDKHAEMRSRRPGLR